MWTVVYRGTHSPFMQRWMRFSEKAHHDEIDAEAERRDLAARYKRYQFMVLRLKTIREQLMLLNG